MIELLLNRRSIRKYKDKPIEKEKVNILKKVAILAPLSRNLCTLQFVFTDKEEIIEKLSQAKSHGSSFLKEAPLAVVVIADETKNSYQKSELDFSVVKENRFKKILT